MKNNISKITILFAAIIMVLLVSCVYRPSKRYFETHSGKTITVLKDFDYIIFEKYEGNEPPKDNFIRLNGQYKTQVRMFFKSNDSVIFLRRGDENTLEIGLDTCKYKIEVYGNTCKDIEEFWERTSYLNPLIISEFSVYPIYDLNFKTRVVISEYIGDSVYIRHFYGANPHHYFEDVFYRYDDTLRDYWEHFRNF